MNDDRQDIINTLQKLGSTDVVWLYGSRAAGKHTIDSDYDLAIALPSNAANRQQLIEEWRYQLSSQLKHTISIVDINKIPTPLAQNIINDGKILLCNNGLRLRSEEQRIWSLWEEYKYEYERIRQSL